MIKKEIEKEILKKKVFFILKILIFRFIIANFGKIG